MLGLYLGVHLQASRIMKIIVQQLGAPEPLALDVDSQATLSDLKTLIRDAKDIGDNVALH